MKNGSSERPSATLGYGDGKNERPERTIVDGETAEHAEIAHSNTVLVVLPQTEKRNSLIGMVIDSRYKIERILGKGAMGVVYEAYHQGLDRPAAVKVLSPEGDIDPNMVRDRFDREAKISAKFQHPNIVQIYDCGILPAPDSRPYLAMEYLKGKDLGDILSEEDKIQWGRARHILLQICKAMEAAHNKGIIHRDLKPGNIFLTEHDGDSDFVKIVDFGIAKSGSSTPNKLQLTHAGDIMGTPTYMSPEQAQCLGLDRRSDIYSLGIIMYEMLTGTIPFTGENYLQILQKHADRNILPKLPTKINPNISKAVEKIILKAMKKDPSDRYQSMAEMAADIEAIPPDINYEDPLPHKNTVHIMREVSPTRSKIRSIIFALAGLTVLGGAGYGLSRFIGYSKQASDKGSLLHKPEPDAGMPPAQQEHFVRPVRQDGGMPRRPDMRRDLKSQQPDQRVSRDNSPEAPVNTPDASQKSEDQSKRRGNVIKIKVKKQGTPAKTRTDVDAGLKKINAF